MLYDYYFFFNLNRKDFFKKVPKEVWSKIFKDDFETVWSPVLNTDTEILVFHNKGETNKKLRCAFFRRNKSPIDLQIFYNDICHFLKICTEYKVTSVINSIGRVYIKSVSREYTLKHKDFCKNHILFSKRLKMASDAERWCNELKVKPCPLNIVSALNDLGYIKHG